MSSLTTRPRRDEDDLNALRTRMNELEIVLEARDSELARIQSGLEAFKAHYRHHVGTLYEQLDELEHAIAEAELGELAVDARDEASEAREAPAPQPEESPRFTSDAIRKLFRDVAKAIHPDLARDELARGRREALMAEANRAYADRDEEQLRLILESWERSPEAVQGSSPAAIRLRLIRRIAQIEERLAEIHDELAEVKDSPLWKLKTQVDEAAANGRDLVAELVARLKRDVMIAGNRLAAMRS